MKVWLAYQASLPDSIIGIFSSAEGLQWYRKNIRHVPQVLELEVDGLLRSAIEQREREIERSIESLDDVQKARAQFLGNKK